MTDYPAGLIESLRMARRVVALTGAGVSAESGVPTFRDAQTGLWAQYRPEDLATPEAFQRDPKLVWEWYAWRRAIVEGVKPNPGHFALVELERRVPRMCLITQNVDGLHQRAGSRAVIELHGNIQRTRCFREDLVIDEWVDTGEVPPRCPRCGGWLRPDVVWFGEALPPIALRVAIEAAQTCDLFFSIGTSALVEPAASLPRLALAQGAVVVEINPTVTPLTSAAMYVLQGPSGQVLPELIHMAWPDRADV